MNFLAQTSTALSPAFGGRHPVFVTDSSAVVSELKNAGAVAYHFHEVPSVPESDLAAVVVLPVQFSETPPGPFMEKHFRDSAMLVIPIASFCQSPRGALYILRMMAMMNLHVSVAGNLKWINELETRSELQLVAEETDIKLELSDEMFLMCPKTSIEISQGEWVSVAQYLEVGLVSHANGFKPRHTVNGVFSADGFVVASHRYAQHGVLAQVGMAWDYLSNIRKRNEGAPIKVEIEDSRPVSIHCGSQDITTETLEFTDPNRREYITEFAFASSAQWPAEHVDWSVNSQLNEAIGGIHIGLGTGVTGVHIDLVAPSVTTDADT